MSLKDLILADAPIRYWRLGDGVGSRTAKDEMGKGNGEYRGNPKLGVPGSIADDGDTAVEFTGTWGEWVRVPHATDLNLQGDFTIFFAVKLISFPAGVEFPGLITKGTPHAGDGWDITAREFGDTPKRPRFRFGAPPVSTVDGDVDAQSVWNYFDFGLELDTTQFLDYAATYDAATTTLRLFAEGVLRNIYTDAAWGDPVNDLGLFLGAGEGGIHNVVLDEVPIFDKRIADARITAYHDARVAAVTPPPSGGDIGPGVVGATTVAAGTVRELKGAITLTGNITVEGTLLARAGVTVTSDGPMRVIHARSGGKLDFQGTRKVGWNRTGDDPTWAAGDDMRTCPIAQGDSTTFAAHVKGNLPPQAFAEVPRTEAFNLTRDLVFDGVRLQIGPGSGEVSGGTAAGVQILKWFSIKNAGDTALLGSYPLHFHPNYEATVGSVVEGVVVQGGKHHAFVPHGSHGITFLDCIAFDTIDNAYWWDPPPVDPDSNKKDSDVNNSHDVVFQHCLAAWVKAPTNVHNVSGFFLAAGGLADGTRRPVIRDCAVAGVQGDSNANGYWWPSSMGTQPKVWIFEDNVVHNNLVDGIFVWQQDTDDHDIIRHISYRNGGIEIDWGAYRNLYNWKDMQLYASGGAELMAAHLSGRIGTDGRRAMVATTIFDCKDVTDYCLTIVKPSQSALGEVLFLNNTYRNYVKNAVNVANGAGDADTSQAFDFVHQFGQPGTDLHPEHFDLTSVLKGGTTIRTQLASGIAWLFDGTAWKSTPLFYPYA